MILYLLWIFVSFYRTQNSSVLWNIQQPALSVPSLADSPIEPDYASRTQHRHTLDRKSNITSWRRVFIHPHHRVLIDIHQVRYAAAVARPPRCATEGLIIIVISWLYGVLCTVL